MFEELINEVKIRPTIWDKSDHSLYKERKSAFVEVTKILNSKFNSVYSVEGIKFMWENLEKEFQKIYETVKHKPSGSAAKATVTTEFPYFENLLFLTQVPQCRQAQSSMDTESKEMASTPSSSIWQLSQKRGSRKRKTDVVPPVDKFAHSEMNEQSNVKDMVGELKSMMEKQSNSILESIKESAINPRTHDSHFTLILQKFKSLPPKDVDNCFLNILEELNDIKKQ